MLTELLMIVMTNYLQCVECFHFWWK